jgi:hypothetical protein
VGVQIAIESQFPPEDQSASLAWHSAQWFDRPTFGRPGGFEISGRLTPGALAASPVC